MDKIEEKKDITVLYVEDDDLIRETLSGIIVDKVKTLYTASNGEEGLRMFREHAVDLVITDIKMPKMDGLEMTRRIRMEASRIPVIVTTAFSDTDFLLQAIEQKIDSFLLKPIRMEQLIYEIAKYSRQIQNERLLDQEKFRSSEYLKAIDSGSGLIRLNRHFTVAHVNDIVCMILSQRCEDIIGTQLETILDVHMFEEIKNTIARGERYEESIALSMNGKKIQLSLSAVGVKNISGEIEEVVIFVNDMSEFFEAKEQLIETLYTDPITGLPNMRRLFQRLESSYVGALAIVKLEKVDQINAIYSREAGEVIFRQVADVIQGFCADTVEVFKLEGKKFAMIPTPAPAMEECQQRMSNLIEAIEDYPFVYRGVELHISAVAVCVHHPIKELYAAAEMVLIDLRKNHFRLRCEDDFEALLHQNEANINAYEALRCAIDENRLVPYFQPIASAADGHIVKYEVLARIVEGDRVYSPDYFLEAAKSSSLYHRLTERILTLGCEAYAHHGKPFSVNLSIIDIDHEPTRQMIRNLMIRFPEATAQMTIEITEEEGVKNFEEVKVFCQEMIALGMNIAIDDFGKGYSNFDVIAHLPITFIKYDGVLVQNLGTSDKFDLLLKKVSEYARENQIYTIAEFVDSKLLMDRVHELGVDYVQGYYISPPVPLESIKVGYDA